MIGRILAGVRLVTFAAAAWITAVVLWVLAVGGKPIETPMLAVWIFAGGLIAQLVLRILDRDTRSS